MFVCVCVCARACACVFACLCALMIVSVSGYVFCLAGVVFTVQVRTAVCLAPRAGAVE